MSDGNPYLDPSNPSQKRAAYAWDEGYIAGIVAAPVVLSPQEAITALEAMGRGLVPEAWNLLDALQAVGISFARTGKDGP